jgi:hypothetical protein
MQTTQRTIRPVFLALALILMAIQAHAEVYKWVDEEGHAHYTEQPPKKGEHTQLRVQAGSSQLQSDSTVSLDLPSSRQAEQKRTNEISAKLKTERELNAEQDRVRAEKRKIEIQEENLKAANDKREIDQCKRNHEVYCDKGVDNIRREQLKKNIGW